MQSFTKNDMVNRLLNSFRLFVCISIVMSVFNPVLIASASSAAVLSVDSNAVDVGNTSVVSISLGNCSNVTNLSFTLSFNESVLEFTDVQNHSGVTGTIINSTSSGSIDVELNGMDNFTTSSNIPIVDVSFKGLVSGNSNLDITAASLTTTEATYSPTVNGGTITVNTVTAPTNDAPVLEAIGNQEVNETELLTFIISATDAEDDELTYSASNLPPGAEFNVSNQTFSWVPAIGTNDTYDVTFNVTDNINDPVSETITITVNPEVVITLNTAPVLAAIGNKVVNETEIISFIISATDEENDELTYSASNLPTGAEFNISNKTFSWVPAIGTNGTYDVTFNVTDGDLNDSETIIITVNATIVTLPNTPPVLESIGNQVINEGETLRIDLNASDLDGDSLLYGTNASFGTLSNDIFTWTPDYDDFGVYVVEFNVTDDENNIDNETISITVNEVIFTPPNPVDFTNTAGNFWVLHSWADGSGNIIDSYNISYNGSWYNVATLEFNTTDLGAHGWSNITVYGFNSTTSTLSSGVDVNVQIPNNDVYIMDVPPYISVTEGQEIAVHVNSTDLDGDTPTFSCNSSLFDFDESTGIGSWTPKHKDSGTHYIEFGVSDEYGSSDSAVMVVTVNERIYTPPEPVNFVNSTGNFWVLHDWEAGIGDMSDTYNVSYNGSWYNGSISQFSTVGLDAHGSSSIIVYAYNATSSTLSSGVSVSTQIPNNDIYITNVTSQLSISEGTNVNVHVNSTDLDGDTPTFACNNTTLFTDFDESTGIGSWTPDYDNEGTYYVNFSVSDGYGSTDSKVMVITVTNNNREPDLGFIPDQEIAEDSTLSFTLSATDADTDDFLVFDAIDKPDGASLNSSTGAFEWTPDYNDSGIYDLEFRVFDGYVYDSQFVEINVTNVNREPQMSTLSDVTVNENDTLFIELGAFDPDGDSLILDKDLEIGSISDGNFTWNTGFEDNGIYDIQFTATDGKLGASQSITITVLNVNRAPVLDNIPSISISEGANVTINLTATDLDDTSLSFSTNASVGILNAITGEFSWTPDYSHNGTHYLYFNVSDGNLSDTKVAIIGVNDANVPPEFVELGPQYVTENNSILFTISADAVDGDILYYTYMGGISTGSISLNPAPMTFIWTPGFNDAGNHSVTFKVSDGVYDDYMTVPIIVSDSNRIPEFTSLYSSYTINESETLTIDLGANDLDTYQTISVWINETGNATGTLTGDVYTWNTDYLDNGTYDMEFVVSDGIVNTSGTTTITVNDVNAPPEFWYIASKTVKETENLQFTINATDIDGDALKYSSVGILPTGSTFNNISRVFSWTPTDVQKGTYSVQFNVTDGIDVDYLTVSVTVQDNEAASTTTTSSGGGGGGGGSQSTGEKFENIDFKDYTIKSVVKDREAVFSFVRENNSIVSLSFVSALNGGQTKTIIECLLDTSSLVSGPAPGTVYKNMNIWVGDGKFVPAMVSDAKIMFKVDKLWMEENEIDPSSISLCRYSGSWDVLTTISNGEDDLYMYFVAESPGFSPFAISSLSEGDMAALTTASDEESTVEDNEQTMSSVVDDVAPVQPNVENQETKKSGFVLPIIILIGLIAIGLVGYRNKDYYSKVRTQLGNPDGKRYRRVKR